MKATALILAGGRSTRMNGVPKCLLPLGDGRSILEHLVEALELAHITPVILGAVDEGVITKWRTGYDVVSLPDDQVFGGTARAVAGAAKFLNHRKDDRILICYGDTFLPGFDYASACYPGTIAIAAERSEFLFDAVGNVNLDFDGVHYVADVESPEVWIDAGATCVRFADLDDIGRYTNLPDWLATQKFNRVCIHDGPVLTTGDPKSYEHAKEWRP